MEAKGFGATWARTFAFFGVFVLLPFTVFIGIASESWLGVAVTLCCGALVFAALALWTALIIRVDEVGVDFADRASFLQAVNEALPSVGYKELSENADALMSKPAGAGVLAPVIHVNIHGTSATFTGPRERVRRLVRYLVD